MPGFALPTPEQRAPGLEQFVNEVAAQTGLDPRVVATWVTVEGAYASNGTGGFDYLNLRPARGDVGVTRVSAGGFDLFGSVEDAIASTVNRIRNPFAAGILASKGKSPATQLQAIANSAWDAGHYSGTYNGKTVWGGSLFTTWSGLFGKGTVGGKPQSNPVSGLGGAGGPVTGTGNILPGVGGFFGGLESWLTGTGKLVLAYIVLVGVAGALFVTGLKGLGVPTPKLPAAVPIPE